MGLMGGGVSARDLILDGQSVSLYVGGNPPIKVWPTRETVQITLGDGFQARDEFRAALTARGLDYTTITEVPFDIELVGGNGNAQHLFFGCHKLISVPPLDTSNVWNMNGMFQECGSLVTVPPLDTRNVWNAPSMFAFCNSLTSVPDLNAAKMTNVSHMFYGCSALTDGNVRLIGKHQNVDTSRMIGSSGLTKEPWYTADGQPWPVGPRKVTIATDNVGQWNKNTVIGDTSLIQGWGASNVVRFVTDVTCNKGSYSSDSFLVQDPGTVLRAGADIKPYKIDTYTFTEVL